MSTILISQRLASLEGPPEIRDCLDARWGKLAQAAGFILVPIASGAHIEDYFQLPDIAGCILSGGNDLATIDSSQINNIRDSVDSRIVAVARVHALPTIGICRGAQFLYQMHGGKVSAVQGHAGTIHRLVIHTSPQKWIVPNEVLSHHNYGLIPEHNIGEVIASGEDGTVEAWHHRESRCLGLMWHPERMASEADAVLLLRGLFLNE